MTAAIGNRHLESFVRQRSITARRHSIGQQKTRPSKSMTTETLTREGFYGTGRASEAMCLMCGARYSDWKPGMSAQEIRSHHFPRCHLLKQTHPGGSRTSDNQTCARESTSTRIHLKDFRVIPSDSSSGNTIVPGKLVTSRTESPSDEEPKHQEFASFGARLSSFSRWTQIVGPSPQQLAEAGLFYTGSNDCVKCYQCGGCLMNWKDGDCVNTEHALWFPDCKLARVHVSERAENKSCHTAASDVPHGPNSDQTAPNAVRSLHAMANGGLDEPRTLSIDPELFTPEAMTLMEMGYEPDIVLAAIETAKMVLGEGNVTVNAILDVLLHQENRQAAMATGNGPEHADPSASPVEGHVVGPGHVTPSSSAQRQRETVPPNDAAFKSGELEMLKNRFLCKICLSDEACIVFLPCGHMITCAKCCSLVVKCCLCRKRVNATVRAYLP